MIDAGWIRWWTALRATPPTPPERGTLACSTCLRIVSASFSTSSTRSPSPSWRGCPRAFTLWYRLINIGGKLSSEWSTNTPTYPTGSKVTILVHNKYFCKSATQYKTPAIHPRSRWEKRRRGWGRLARKRTGEHDIFFGHFKNEPMHCIAMFQNWYIYSLFRGIAKELNTFWRKNDKYKPSTQRNCQYFCQRDDQQKIVSFVWESNCGV